VQVGVVTRKIITESKNPNKWDKHMAPWYNDECKQAKIKYKQARRKYGRKSPPAQTAFK
jgi:hypothetical protein